MRQGQQNRRGRGRNNNNNSNRKSQNPLTRSFESAGPDIKIRGTPSHIAEKYVALARDALSSGDPVLAENYLQHAEHYNRIILSFREQQMSQGGVDPFHNGMARTHTLGQPDGSDPDDLGDEDQVDFGSQPQPSVPPPQFSEGAQQPFGQGQPPQQRNFDQPYRNDQRPRHEGNRYNNQRQDRGDGQRYDRNNDRGDREFRGDRQERFDRNNGPGNGEHRYRDDRRPQGQGDGNFQGDNGYRRRDRFQGPNGQNQQSNERDLAAGGFQPAPPAPPQAQPQPAPAVAAALPAEQDQPAFLRRPVRRPRREEPAEAPAAAAPTPPEEAK